MHDHTTMLPIVSMDDAPADRRGSDLALWRVLLGLAVAPLLGAALMTLGIYLLSPTVEGFRWKELTLSMLGPTVWSLICGLTYLQTVTRMRHGIALHECLLLGSGSGMLLPFVVDFAGTLFLRERFPTVDWDHLKIYAFAGLFTLPFGLFGGWLFWRIGVRPAVPRMQDMSGVFD